MIRTITITESGQHMTVIEQAIAHGLEVHPEGVFAEVKIETRKPGVLGMPETHVVVTVRPVPSEKPKPAEAKWIYLADSIPDLPAPFSGPRYSENADRCGQAQPCVICGKAVRGKKAPMVYVADGGRVFVSDAEAAQLQAAGDSGFMGGYPIGPECWRYHAAAFAALVRASARAANSIETALALLDDCIEGELKSGADKRAEALRDFRKLLLKASGKMA
jgi:hypothetical protein